MPELGAIPPSLLELPLLPDSVLYDSDQSQQLDQGIQLFFSGKHWSDFSHSQETLDEFGIQICGELPLLTESTVALLLPAIGELILHLGCAEQSGVNFHTHYDLSSVAQELVFRLQEPTAEDGTTVISEVRRQYSKKQIHALTTWFPFGSLSKFIDISDILEELHMSS
jgi:hypothetical protein